MTGNRYSRAVMVAALVVGLGSTSVMASPGEGTPTAATAAEGATAAGSSAELPTPAYLLGPDFGLVAQALGMTPEALIKALRNGQSVTDLANQQKVDLQLVIQAATTFQRASREADRAEGVVGDTESEAQEADDQDTARADLASPGAMRPGVGNFRKQYGVSLFEQAAGALKMDAAALLSALRSGKSINDLAATQSVNVQTSIIDPLVSQETARLQALVTAGGLTQAQADTALQRLRDYLAWRVATPGTGIGAMGRGIGPGFGRGPASGPHSVGGPGNGRGQALGRTERTATPTPAS